MNQCVSQFFGWLFLPQPCSWAGCQDLPPQYDVVYERPVIYIDISIAYKIEGNPYVTLPS